jgi:glucosamine-6-phosphate isomerase
MQIQVFKDSAELSDAVAQHIIEVVKNKPTATLVLTSGDTPKNAYRRVADLANPMDFEHVTIIGLDEWVGVPPSSEGSCKYIVEENLLKPLGIKPKNYTFFDSLSPDLEAECRRVDTLIFEKGGLDFILVGIGLNGHLGLNEPGSSFDAYCQVTDLEQQTIEIGQKYFTTATPLEKGITVGLKHLLEAKVAMVMASGKAKAEIVAKMIGVPISEALPATVLRKHQSGFLWIDQAAAN